MDEEHVVGGQTSHQLLQLLLFGGLAQGVHAGEVDKAVEAAGGGIEQGGGDRRVEGGRTVAGHRPGQSDAFAGGEIAGHPADRLPVDAGAGGGFLSPQLTGERRSCSTGPLALPLSIISCSIARATQRSVPGATWTKSSALAAVIDCRGPT